MPTTLKEQRANTLKRLASLKAFMERTKKAPRSVSPVRAPRSAPAKRAPRSAPAKRAPRSAPAKRAPRTVSPVRAPRRAASVPAKSALPSSVFGPVTRPVGYMQPQEEQVSKKKAKRELEKELQAVQLRHKAWLEMSPSRRQELQNISKTSISEFRRIMDAQAQQYENRLASERLAKQKAQEQVAANKAKRNAQKEQERAALRMRAYNAASADKKKLIDMLGKQSDDLSAYNKLMNALAQQQEQRQIAQRKALYDAKSQAQKAQLDKITDPVLYDKKLREKRLTFSDQIAQKAKKRAQRLQNSATYDLAEMKPQGPRSGQSVQDFKLRMSRQATQARSAFKRLPSYDEATGRILPELPELEPLSKFVKPMVPPPGMKPMVPPPGVTLPVSAPVQSGGFWF